MPDIEKILRFIVEQFEDTPMGIIIPCVYVNSVVPVRRQHRDEDLRKAFNKEKETVG